MNLSLPLVVAVAIFSRAQLKYGAEQASFLHRWYERPLHQDTRYAAANDSHFLNEPAWRKTVETVRLGKMAGLAVCITQSNRSDAIGRSVLPGAETTLLVELPYAYSDTGIESYVEVAGKALAMPNAYRIDGKVVLTRYPPIKLADLPFYEKLRARLREKYGDKFVVMPYTGLYERNIYTPLTPVQTEEAKERLRRILRATDGFFYSGRDAYVNRRFVKSRFDEMVTAVVRSVLDEPEFKGKKRLGTWVTGGHENDYRWQYVLDSTGTQMLADTLWAVESLRPDFVICCEWDEENENTHFRPTISNGFTTQRMLRYWADRYAGRAPEKFPGDNAAVPNLVVSYRKSLMLGEPIEVEVRNIPDGTFSGKTFSVAFSWLDEKGVAAKSFPAVSLAADDMTNAWFTVPVAELVANRTLRPRLEVAWRGGRAVVGKTFFPLDLNVQRNLDHKWVKHALREIPRGISGDIEIGAPDSTGVRIVRGKVSSSGRRLRSIEVLDDMDSAYVYSPEESAPPPVERFTVSFAGEVFNTMKHNPLEGFVRVSGAPNAVLRDAVGPARRKIPVKDGAWMFSGIACNNFGGTLRFEVPANEVAGANVEIDLKPFFSGSVDLKTVVEKGVYGFNGGDCAGLVVSRVLATQTLPNPFLGKDAEFSFRWKPLEKTSVLRLQCVDEDFHVWNGKPKTIFKPSGEKVAVSFYERDAAKTFETRVDAARLEAPRCDFPSDRGSAYILGSGRALAGMKGATVTPVQGFGRGESHYGNSVGKYFKPGEAKSDGWGCMSQQIVPCFLGFALEMRVKPAGFGRRQGLLSSGNCGFDLFVDADGSLGANLSCGHRYEVEHGLLHTKVRGPKLRDGEWNVVRLVTDRRTAFLEVNGERGKSVPYEDYFCNQRYACYGVLHRSKDFFDGEIASLSVTPAGPAAATEISDRNKK